MQSRRYKIDSFLSLNKTMTVEVLHSLIFYAFFLPEGSIDLKNGSSCHVDKGKIIVRVV